MKEFSFYDFAGVVAPGALVLFGLSLLVPDTPNLGSLPQIQLGGLGVFAALAYVTGQLTQAVGNLIESLYWRPWGGMPSAWIRSGDLLSPKQYERLGVVLAPVVGATTPAGMDGKHWFSVTREVYAAVSQAKRADRVDVFNGIYGLTRGIASAGIILLVGVALVDWHAWQAMVGLALLTVIAIYRMHRFGVHYARELFVQFLDLRSSPSPQ